MPSFNVQNAKSLEITEGVVKTIHDQDNTLLWGAVGYSTKYQGDTEQTTLSGKNLLRYPYYDTPNSPVTRYDVTWTDMGDGTVKANGTPSGASQFIFFSSQAGLPIEPNTTYTISGGDKTKGVVFTFEERDAGGTVVATHDNIDTLTFTTNENAHTLTGGLKRYSNSITIDNFICKPQLEKGSTPTSWEQYCGGTASPNPDFPQDVKVVTGTQTITINSTTYTVNLGSMELCKIGTYQDYIYKTNGNWYKHAEIGKATFTGDVSENWLYQDSGTNTNRFRIAITDLASQKNGYCNSNEFVVSGVSTDTQLVGIVNSIVYYRINKSTLASTTPSDFKTWLTTHHMVIYTALVTATDTQITDTDLIAQLDDVEEWLTRYGYTATVSGTLPLIINQTALS